MKENFKTKYSKEEIKHLFFTSDSHFQHTNIIKYCNRPFSSVEEMNEKLIQYWNETVSDDYIVFHLGDFAFCGPTKVREIKEQLNGKIILIKGNHDYDSTLKLFDNVFDQLLLNLNGDLVYLNHYPFLTFAGAYRSNVYNLFGHIHTCKNLPPIEDPEIEQILNEDSSRAKYLLKNQYDVGVDNNDYRPVSWLEIKNKLKNED